ncbi:hypothetical protein AVEN_219874-1 [Araneus ventricosus]|uniref:Uncharacterized protein n=1 Tax=Araneus ventricosus TaxID=182803 RepID=A0A4Y2SJW1_ARAVE|nr:hypothetical protein AVEN_219874-1 [Araneus ventricosus]
MFHLICWNKKVCVISCIKSLFLYEKVLSIRNSSIISLSDSNNAFEGLNNQLHLIEIVNCTYLSSWDWTQLSNLKHLMEIHVSYSELTHITDGLTSIQNLDIEAFVFHRNKIQDIADNAFAPFENLERLALDNNYIAELKRSMFPTKAKKLSILGLSYNQLQDLPEDLFSNMPALKSLYLTGNPLVTIDERVFRPIWKSLKLFLFYGEYAIYVGSLFHGIVVRGGMSRCHTMMTGHHSPASVILHIIIESAKNRISQIPFG